MTKYGIRELKRRVKENKVLTFEERKYINKALEEIQQYRAIGTVEEVESLKRKLETIESIMLKWNADYYNDVESGVPDNEVLESILNVCKDNGLDIDIEQDYRQGYSDAIGAFADCMIVMMPEHKRDIQKVADDILH